MKQGWITKAFEECILPIEYTRKIQRSDFLPHGHYPVVSQEAALVNGYWNEEADVFRVSKPLVVFGDHTRVLKFVDFDFVLGADGVKILAPRHELDSKFFYYQLHTAKLDSLGYARHYRLLKELNVVVPSLPEQHRIVAILDRAFQAIDTAKANTEKNLLNARALFDSHQEAVVTTLLERSGERRLGDVCVVKTGKKDVNEGNPNGAYPFFTCAAEHTFSDVYSFDTEALLIAGNGNVGQVSYFSGRFEAYQRTYVLSDFRDAEARYLYQILDRRLSESVSKQKLGNTMPYIKMGMLTEYLVPIPPIDEQRAATKELERASHLRDESVSLYQRKLAALDELKQSLLHEAFSGNL